MANSQPPTRSSYNVKNALHFKNWFDDIILNPSADHFLSRAFIGCGIKVCQQRLSDALLYLARNYDEMLSLGQVPPTQRTNTTQIDYIRLKGMCRFHIVYEPELGLKAVTSVQNITLYQGDRKVKEQALVEKLTVNADWKDKVVEFISKKLTTEPQILSIDNLYLKPDDIEWLRDVFLKADCEFDIEGTRGFKAVRG